MRKNHVLVSGLVFASLSALAFFGFAEFAIAGVVAWAVAVAAK